MEGIAFVTHTNQHRPINVVFVYHFTSRPNNIGIMSDICHDLVTIMLLSIVSFLFLLLQIYKFIGDAA